MYSYVSIHGRLEKESLSLLLHPLVLETVSVESTSSYSQGHQLSGAGTKRPKVSGTSHGTPQCLMDHQSSTSHDAEKTSKAAPARIASLQTHAARKRRTRRSTNENIKAARARQRTSRGSDPDGTLLSSRLGQEHFFFHKQHRHDLDFLNPSMQSIPACESNIIGKYWSQSIQTCSPSQVPPTPATLVVLQESWHNWSLEDCAKLHLKIVAKWIVWKNEAL